MPSRREAARSGVVGGIVAGVVLGVVFQFGTDQLQMQAALYVATPDVWTGWLVHLVHSTLIGLVYAGIVAAYTNWYVDRLLSVTRRWGWLTSAVMPLVRTFGIGTVVTSGMGLTVGLFAWLAFAGVALPLVLAGYPVPQVSLVATLGYLVYGLGLGTLYGIQVSRA